MAHRQGRLSETAVDLADSARPHHTSLSFRPALYEHSALVAQIYNDVSAWLHDVKGIRGQWARQVPEPEVHQWIDSGELHIVQGQTEPVGVLRISTDGGDMWTDRRGEALYVSGLAVLRRFSGKQLGYQILRKVAELAHGQRKEFVRLDCMAANDRLRQYYVDGGFEPLGEHPTKRWFARFEKRIR